MLHATDTLIIKHLPADLNDNEKEELLRHFGATQVKCISSKVNKYNIAFARFQSEHIAGQVLHRLHQININGCCLSVEFAKAKDCEFAPEEQKIKDFENDELIENEKCYKRFIEKLNAWHSSFNFKQPVPMHLRYQYPPPDNVALLNIVKILATVPKFYTQVLHLMNKMNLPCPFGKDVLPDFDIQLVTKTDFDEKIDELGVAEGEPIKEVEIQEETSESEISSDDEVKLQKERIPDQVPVRKRKVMNLPKFVKLPTVPQGIAKQKKTSIEEVFEKVSDQKEVKKIKLSHPSVEAISQIQQSTPSETSHETASGFGFIHPAQKPDTPQETKIDVRDEREEERLEKPQIECITGEELAQNRIPEKDRSVLPVFKNYAEGAPTSRLYIKNLAKTVTEEDLRFIYNRYLSTEIGVEPNALEIRLMQEGRMKGQAFVTFQTVKLAQSALKETNGYILKDKPLVVQFARSASK